MALVFLWTGNFAYHVGTSFLPISLRLKGLCTNTKERMHFACWNAASIIFQKVDRVHTVLYLWPGLRALHQCLEDCLSLILECSLFAHTSYWNVSLELSSPSSAKLEGFAQEECLLFIFSYWNPSFLPATTGDSVCTSYWNTAFYPPVDKKGIWTQPLCC